MLVGRRAEVDAIDDMIARVRDRTSAALVLCGEAGIGKTALLDCPDESAAGFQVVRVTGIESEMELGFSGVHQLIRGFEKRVSRLPPAQRDALGSAFGRVGAHPTDSARPPNG